MASNPANCADTTGSSVEEPDSSQPLALGPTVSKSDGEVRTSPADLECDPASSSSAVPAASSHVDPSVMDTDSVKLVSTHPGLAVKEEVLRTADTATETSASPAKPKQKEEQPQTSGSSKAKCETALSDSASTQEAGDGAEALLTDGLQSLSLTGTDPCASPEAGAAEPKKKKRNRRKKKKKESGEKGSEAESGLAAEEVADGKEEDGGKEQECGGGQGSTSGAGNAQASLELPENIRRLQENLLRRQKNENMTEEQRQTLQNKPEKKQNPPQSGNKKHQHKKTMFESHWPKEKVAEGLKKGTLIEGRIRINPKNYEDAYIPFPDGTTDIYIAGMAARNRALNGDIVAVMLQDRDSWRVFRDKLEDYEKVNTPPSTTSGEVLEDAGQDADSDPDVIVEEDVQVEPVTSTQINDSPNAGVLTPSSQDTSTPQKDSTASAGAKPKEKPNKQKHHNSPGSAHKHRRYMSVKEVMDQGSSVARKLFSSEGTRPAGTEGQEGSEAGGVKVDSFIQRTGKVVAIIEKKHSRAASGNLKPLQGANHKFTTFSPTDSRVPRIMIPVSELPTGFKERPEDFTKVLFIARITEWCESSNMPKGQLARSLGEAGQVEPETEALLIENDVDSSEFSEEVLACLPQETPWRIPAEELARRRDLRQECIFTIDPSTARDLDDALHCTDLGDGVFEVGVHIADVSYFVKEDTELDRVASERATSVYLVQKVIPMLPRLLCEQLCSLNPDEDRLSFSVIWKITEDGQILEEWFGRTVIRSCVKLSYDHAQGFIENPKRQWTADELPPLSKGFTVEDIKTRVLQLDKIAKAMRKARFDSGALRLDQVKIQFTLSKETGLPNGYFPYQQKDSNKLVEEFMLLANMAVAHKIRASHRDKALLRRHPPPQSRMIDELKDLCASLGFPIKADTAKEMQMSIARYTGKDELSQARLQVLVVLCSRPMQNAKYFCCGVLADEKLYHHYALNVPLYTHFTSPIRRYPDVLVHRTLAAALGYCDITYRSSPEIQQIAERCNDKKASAKLCSEKSNELYFSIFVKEAGPLQEKGMVMAVLDKSFDVYVLSLGVVKRVYCEKLPLERFSYQKDGKRPELTLVWKADDGCPRLVTQKLSIFSSVLCSLQSESEPLKFSAIIHRPLEGDPSIVE